MNRLDRWLAERTTTAAPGDVEAALSLKAQTTVSVVIPAKDEAQTVGGLVAALRSTLGGLVDELVVVDDGSTDGTGPIAEAAGARVLSAASVRPDAPAPGKGGALWRGVVSTHGDVVVFLDADVRQFAAYNVASLLLPLFRNRQVVLVKAAYTRSLQAGGVAHPGSGGRITRLVARPVLDVVQPELTVFEQPLAGETAVRRSMLERVPFVGDYGFELALLMDAHRIVGLDGLAQVRIGERTHRHQSDEALARMATAVLRVAAHRAGWTVADPGDSRLVHDPDGRLRHDRVPMGPVLMPPLQSGSFCRSRGARGRE